MGMLTSSVPAFIRMKNIGENVVRIEAEALRALARPYRRADGGSVSAGSGLDVLLRRSRGSDRDGEERADRAQDCCDAEFDREPRLCICIR